MKSDMRICAKCGENIEDQFDSCWKCAGAAQTPPPAQDLYWVYPVISLTSSLGLGCLMGEFWHSPHHSPGYFGLGGAVVGVVMSVIGVWAFFRCPLRHWLAKFFSLLFMIGSLFNGVLTVGSFLIHLFGYDVA
jgi:hypothetical protein